SLTQVPAIWTNSPALINAARPTTVRRSLWPRALTRRTQNPFSGLWNVTRSTRPARASLAAVWAIFATSFAPSPNRLRWLSLPAAGLAGRHWLATAEQHRLESDHGAHPGQGTDQGARREDRVERVHQGGSHGRCRN